MGNPKSPSLRRGEVDRLVGEHIARYIRASGLELSQIARQADLTSDELTAFISGVRRAGPSKLQVLSQVLDVPVTAFFMDEPDAS